MRDADLDMAEALVWHHGYKGLDAALSAAESPTDDHRANVRAELVARLAADRYMKFKHADTVRRAEFLERWSRRQGQMIRDPGTCRPSLFRRLDHPEEGGDGGAGIHLVVGLGDRRNHRPQSRLCPAAWPLGWQGLPLRHEGRVRRSHRGRRCSAMEVLARDLRSLGLYTARSLSYDGVEYELVEHRLTDEQRHIYDAYAGTFAVIHNNLDAAMQAANITGSEGTLNRHLMTEHQLTPEIYRAKWGLRPDYSMVAPNYSAQRQALTKQIGLGPSRFRRRPHRSRNAGARLPPEPAEAA